MDSQSTNLLEISTIMSTEIAKHMKEIDGDFENQLSRLHQVAKNLLNHATNSKSNYQQDKNIKSQSETQNAHVGDLFATESGFRQPAAPPISRITRRQASIAIADKTKNVRESATISSSTTTSQARPFSTFSTCMDIALDLPKANSTFVVDKKLMVNGDESLSLQISPFGNKKPNKSNETYNVPTKAMNISKNMGSNMISEESPSHVRSNSPAKSMSSKKQSVVKKRSRAKLDDIDVNIEEIPTQPMTRTKKKNLEEKIRHLDPVPLEIITTPQKTLDNKLPTHLLRENKAEKIRDMYLKSKVDQNKKFGEQHLKVAKQREEQMKQNEEKMKKAAEDKKKRAEKLREKELLAKEEALKKQKLADQKLADIAAKRKQAEKAKMLKLQKTEAELKLKEDEKKKLELKLEKPKSKVTLNTPSIPTVVPKPKLKAGKFYSNINDYGLNDVSARDSSDDETGPKKPVPSWATYQNRKPIVAIQTDVDCSERNLFFDCPVGIPLKAMFKGWIIRDRVRTSSAVWNKSMLREHPYPQTL